jgi:copper chaperone CopZ
MAIIKKKFKIEGMHCTSCAMTIEMDVEDLDGVIACKTSYAKGETECEFDPSKVSEETILETIKKSGYNATSIAN